MLDVGASFGYILRSGIAGSSGNTISNFLRYQQTGLQTECLYQLEIPPTLEECPFSPHACHRLLSLSFDLSYSDWYEVESQNCLDLYFPHD